MSQVITYRITTVRVNDEPARDPGAEAQTTSKDSASGEALESGQHSLLVVDNDC